MRSTRPLPGTLAVLAAALLGCSSSSMGPDPNTLAAPTGITPYVAPPATLGAGTILLSASGETLALDGFDWPPSGMDDTCMVDGWEFKLDRYLTVLSDVTVWSDPDAIPSDPTQHGPVVAHVAGPWVVDLHAGGPLMGKGGGGEQAQPFGAILAMDDGSAFDPTLTYGFGFSTIAATPDVYDVNLTPADRDAYTNVMIPNGYSVLYEGTATYKGGSDCQQVTSGTGADQVTYDFSKLPAVLPFRLGFSTPTSYINCQNGTDLPGAGVNGEDHPRGVQVSPTDVIVAQVTIHMDHPFWESFAENSPLHWDQIAAQYVGVASPLATVEDLKTVAATKQGLDFTAFTDNLGAPLPWRTCSASFYTPTGSGQLHFDPLEIKVGITGSDASAATGLHSYYDFIRYTQATQGHLNSQGLCYIGRNYPSPGGGT